MNQPKNLSTPFERVPTGVKGLDQLLNGGFLKGGTYLFLGPPGSGKTVLANQLGFHTLKSGGKALYVTLLAESHSRMFGNLSSLAFFEQEQVAQSIQYISGYSTLEKEGLDGLMQLLGEEIRKHKADLLFIDGIASADELAGTPVRFKKFVHNLNSVVGISGGTTFLLSSLEHGESQPEHTMVDGILNLSFNHDGLRTVREVEVRKFRGSAHLYGRHPFRINSNGLIVFPRVEARIGRGRPLKFNMSKRLSFDIPDLDRLIDGGLISGSVTSLLGPAGTGKTNLGMRFLSAGARNKENSLLVSFYESPEHMNQKLIQVGLDPDMILKEGIIDRIWLPQAELIVDEFVDQLLEKVNSKKFDRLFIDGVGGIKETATHPDRVGQVMTALSQELRACGVTTIFTEETKLFNRDLGVTASDLSAVTDNIFFLKHVEISGRLTQALSIIKTRSSSHDSNFRELQITSEGIHIGEPIRYPEPYIPQARLIEQGSEITKAEIATTSKGPHSGPGQGET